MSVQNTSISAAMSEVHATTRMLSERIVLVAVRVRFMPHALRVFLTNEDDGGPFLLRVELECHIFVACGSGVPDFRFVWNWNAHFCCVRNWNARFILCVELECHIFVSCGTGVPDFCSAWN